LTLDLALAADDPKPPRYHVRTPPANPAPWATVYDAAKGRAVAVFYGTDHVPAETQANALLAELEARA
jgi:hypothetical protein